MRIDTLDRPGIGSLESVERRHEQFEGGLVPPFPKEHLFGPARSGNESCYLDWQIALVVATARSVDDRPTSL